MYCSYSAPSGTALWRANQIDNRARRGVPQCVAESTSLLFDLRKAQRLRKQNGGALVAVFRNRDMMKSTDRVLPRHRSVLPHPVLGYVVSSYEFELQAVWIFEEQGFLPKI